MQTARYKSRIAASEQAGKAGLWCGVGEGENDRDCYSSQTDRYQLHQNPPSSKTV